MLLLFISIAFVLILAIIGILWLTKIVAVWGINSSIRFKHLLTTPISPTASPQTTCKNMPYRQSQQGIGRIENIHLANVQDACSVKKNKSADRQKQHNQSPQKSQYCLSVFCLKVS
jgi:hypothetical protein